MALHQCQNSRLKCAEGKWPCPVRVSLLNQIALNLSWASGETRKQGVISTLRSTTPSPFHSCREKHKVKLNVHLRYFLYVPIRAENSAKLHSCYSLLDVLSDTLQSPNKVIIPLRNIRIWLLGVQYYQILSLLSPNVWDENKIDTDNMWSNILRIWLW